MEDDVPIPPEVIDPLGNLSARQRGQRKWYLKNAERKRIASLRYYYKNKARASAIQRETYWIRKYLGRQDFSWILEVSPDALRKVARWYATLARLLVLRENDLLPKVQKSTSDASSSEDD